VFKTITLYYNSIFYLVKDFMARHIGTQGTVIDILSSMY